MSASGGTARRRTPVRGMVAGAKRLTPAMQCNAMKAYRLKVSTGAAAAATHDSERALTGGGDTDAAAAGRRSC